MGWERVVCGGRETNFGFRNKNKTKVGFSLVYGDILGKIKGGSGLKGNDFNIFSVYNSCFNCLLYLGVGTNKVLKFYLNLIFVSIFLLFKVQ